jgi:hypothetical protein
MIGKAMGIDIGEPEHLNRRKWICQVIQAAGAGLAVQSSPAQEHIHDAAAKSASETASTWTPAFLSRKQSAALVAIGERIIPGSKEAHCNRIIDLVLSIDSEKNQREFLNALQAFESAAHERSGGSLAALQAQPLDELLTEASTHSEDLRPHFGLLKEWLADTYWSSREGLKEVGWTGRVVWAGYDGCAHAGGHA